MNIKNINIESRMKHYHVNGLSIATIENSQITGAENYGLLEVEGDQKVTEHSIFSACSISKFLTGIVVIKLVEEQLLNLDENVNDKLVAWKVFDNEYTKHKKVTLRNLLSHQSGILDPEGSFSKTNSYDDIPSMVELLSGNTPYCKVRIDVGYEPESDFHYSDAGFCIIQQLIEDVTKKPFYQVVNELVFIPLNMNISYLNITKIAEINKKNFSCGHNKKGEVVDGKYPIYPYPAASGLWTTSLDLAKLVLELMNALKGKSEIGISPTLAKELITSQNNKSWTGLGVFLEGSDENLEISSLGWGEGFQCMMFSTPYLSRGAVIMTNSELGVHQMEGIIGEIYRSLIS